MDSGHVDKTYLQEEEGTTRTIALSLKIDQKIDKEGLLKDRLISITSVYLKKNR